MKQSFKKLLLLTATLSLVAVTLPHQIAHAAFPGQNGKVTWGRIGSAEDLEDGTGELLSASINGGNQTLLIATPSMPFAPRYSADGAKLTFSQVSLNDDTANVYVAAASGSGVENITNVETGKMAVFSSFYPDGNQLAYSESWGQDFGDGSVLVGQIRRINTDGTGKTALTELDENHCDMYPVVSPDGSKIAFYRGDRSTNTSGIWIMNADGTNQRELVRRKDGAQVGCGMSTMIAFLADPDWDVPAFDWAPDGSTLVSSWVDIDSGVAEIRAVNLAGEQTVLYHKTPDGVNEIEGTGYLLATPQYTPDGQIIFRQIEQSYSSEDFSIASHIKLINADGTNERTINTTTPEDFVALEEGSYMGPLVYSHYGPTVQPLPISQNSENTATFANAETAGSVMLQTPEATTITCSNALKESTSPKQDAAYDYPLGLVEFCFDTESTENQVSLTFVTDLKPDQVIARKYNSTNQTYFNIQNATITQTTHQGKSALQLTYTIEDNGALDLDPATGSIKDPVGLAIRREELAQTGRSPYMFIIAGSGLMGIALMTLHQRQRYLRSL